MDPDEILLRSTLQQVFETDRHVAQPTTQGLNMQKVLSELQTLPTRVTSDFALLNARIDQLTDTVRTIDATL